jgi:hypothetical protein
LQLRIQPLVEGFDRVERFIPQFHKRRDWLATQATGGQRSGPEAQQGFNFPFGIGQAVSWWGSGYMRLHGVGFLTVVGDNHR